MAFFAIPGAIFWVLLVRDALLSGECRHGARAHKSRCIAGAGPANQHTHAR